MDAAAHGLVLRSSCARADANGIAEDIAGMDKPAATVMADGAGEAETLVEGDGTR